VTYLVVAFQGHVFEPEQRQICIKEELASWFGTDLPTLRSRYVARPKFLDLAFADMADTRELKDNLSLLFEKLLLLDLLDTGDFVWRQCVVRESWDWQILY
jgi:hypothetical protein